MSDFHGVAQMVKVESVQTIFRGGLWELDVSIPFPRQQGSFSSDKAYGFDSFWKICQRDEEPTKDRSKELIISTVRGFFCAILHYDKDGGLEFCGADISPYMPSFLHRPLFCPPSMHILYWTAN